MIQRLCIFVVLCAALAACTPAELPFIAAAPTPTATATATPVPTPTATATATPVPTATATPTPSATPKPSATPRPSATPIPVTPTATLAPVGQGERQAIFEQVWGLVRDQYVYTDYRGLDWQAVHDEYAPKIAAAATPDDFYGLMHELIDRLGDQHSRFDSPQEVAADAANSEGDLVYVGIGAIIRDVDDGGLITRIGRGGPAEEAGLQPGDVVLKIDGIAFTDQTAFGPNGPVGSVRGPTGTQVTLTIRSGNAAPRDVMVTRRPIPSDAFPPIEAQRLPNSAVGYLAINTFALDKVDQRARAELETLLNAGPLSGLIIDVRTNTGGRVDLMLNTIGLFADGGTIGQSAGRSDASVLRPPTGRTLPQLAGVPIVVLTDSGSVSAAEMFAAGMQVLGRARVVGMPSAGNTENLRPHGLPDGSLLWLAELTFTLPDKTPIEGRGVQPDRVVDAEWWRFPLASDPQVLAAQEELQK